jgi:PAS domain S-box-containing protein
LPGITRAWNAHIEGDTDFYLSEWRLRTADGSWRWILARGKVIERDAQGRATRMVGAYTDITEHKRSEFGLADSTAELDAIFRSSRDGIALVGPDLRVLRANQAAEDIIERFSGVRLAVGAEITEIPSLNPARPVIRDIERALAGVRNIPERMASNRDGSIWVELSYSPVTGADGSVIGVAVGLRDCTEKQRLEQSRLQAMRLESLGLLAGGIAHDFNNLLGAITGNIEVAQLGSLDEDTRAGLEEARQAARRAAELVQELLAFAGKQQPVVLPLDISALTHEMTRYARKIPGNRVTIEEDLARALPPVDGDATQVRQLILNLIVNALDATRDEGTTVNVRTWSLPDPAAVARDLLLPQRAAPLYVALRVHDDGPGMSPDVRARIFDPFFTTKATGHGLGLASVLGTIRSHGGTIHVESEPGGGAAFTVFFPAAVGAALTSA